VQTTTAGMIKGLISCAQEHGLSIPEGLQITELLVLPPESVVALSSLLNAVQSIITENQCPQLPLLFGQWLVGKDTSLVGFICENCDTLAESFAMTMRYSSIGKTKNPMFGSAYFNMEEHDDQVHVVISYSDEAYEKYGSEMVIARICSSIRKTVRDDFPFTKLTFRHAKQAKNNDYADVLRSPVEFNSQCNSIVFPKENLQEKVVAAQPYIKSILRKYADAILEKSLNEPEYVKQIRQIIIEDIVKGAVSLQHVSKKLAMSPSSLQRRLKANQLTFSQIIKEVKKRLAKEYLLNGQSVTTTTFLLGFSDTSAFNRAFKQWYGINPSELIKHS